jgi:hypothetical protein
MQATRHACCDFVFVYGAEARHVPMQATTRPRVLPYRWRAKTDRYSGVVSTCPKCCPHMDVSPCAFHARHEVVCSVGC